jgi:hypothetical protein
MRPPPGFAPRGAPAAAATAATAAGMRDPEAEGEEEEAEESAETYAEHAASAAHRARAWQARKYVRAFRRHVAAPAALLGAAREFIVVLAMANDFNVNGNVVSAGAGAQQAQAAENAAEAEGDDVNAVAINVGKSLALLEASSKALVAEANAAKASRAWAKVRHARRIRSRALSIDLTIARNTSPLAPRLALLFAGLACRRPGPGQEGLGRGRQGCARRRRGRGARRHGTPRRRGHGGAQAGLRPGPACHDPGPL